MVSLALSLALSGTSLAQAPAEKAAPGDPAPMFGGKPEVVFSLQPDQYRLSMCSPPQATHVVASVEGLQAFSIRLIFDPALVAISDLDTERVGTQLRIGEAVRTAPHTVVANDVDVNQGVAQLSVELSDGARLDGEVTLATVVWLPKQPGDGQIAFQEATVGVASDEVPSISTRASVIHVSAACGLVSGVCRLQGRRIHDMVLVVNDRGESVRTDELGNFSISGTSVITLSHPAYVTAQANLSARLSQVDPLSSMAQVNIGEIELQAGDVNGDDLVNVFDLTYMANHFQSDFASADINGDGIVDVLDMVLVANNFGIQGPIVVQ